MTYVDQGTLGAFRQTWRKGNPRSLLKTIIEKNPKADAAAIYKLFWEEVEDDKEIVQTIVGYWLDHNVQSLVSSSAPAPANPGRPGNGRPPASAASERLRHRIHYETRIVLLDLVQANDKPLGECTGADCAKFGGWLFKLSQKVPANSKVASVLTEEEVYKLWIQAKNFKKK